MKQPIVHFITPGNATIHNFPQKKREILETIQSAVRDGVSMVQIREKLLPARLVFDLSTSAAAITTPGGVKLLVNDRADIAFSAGADGVHLPADAIPADVLRRAISGIIGVSAHALEEIRTAQSAGADFVTYGPVFETPDKGEPKGLDDLKHVCKAAGTFPIIALGGINETNFESVLAAGAAGFAAIRSLNDPRSRSRIVSRLEALGKRLR